MLRYFTGRTTKLSGVLVIVAIVMVVASVINSQFQIPKIASNKSVIYDKTFERVLRELSESVPQNETLVVSDYPTHFKYFSNHVVKVPWGITSEEILFNNMVQNNRTYLVVIENSSAELALSPLFSSSGLHLLEKDFDKLQSYDSDFFKVHLYKTRESI